MLRHGKDVSRTTIGKAGRVRSCTFVFIMEGLILVLQGDIGFLGLFQLISKADALIDHLSQLDFEFFNLFVVRFLQGQYFCRLLIADIF